MHRLISGLITIVTLGIIMCSSSPTVINAQFATNTPINNAAPAATTTQTPTTESSPVPTERSSRGGIFTTNTPSGPTTTPPPTATSTTPPTATATATATATTTPTPTATFTPSNTPSPTPTPNGPFSYPEGVNPLTGQPYPDADAQSRRNLIVKISNFPPVVRPQHGVNSADLVYEYEAEGGVTRFAAIFRSQSPERVGSIRSGRLLDMDLVTMYRALLAYSGTSAPIQELLLSDDFFEFQLLSPSIGHDCERDGFCRDDELLAAGVPREHTLFGNTEKMWETATRQNVNTGYQAFGFAFGEEPDPNGTPVLDAYIEWYGQTNARWQYDEESGRYLRYTDGVAHFDALDNEQLWIDNLVIIEVEHIRCPNLFEPGARNESIDILVGGQQCGQAVEGDGSAQGRAVVIRDGQSYNGFWRRRNTNPGSALQLIYGDNTSILLKPGRTWVTVVRGLGNTNLQATRVDADATATIIASTPSPTPFVSTNADDEE